MYIFQEKIGGLDSSGQVFQSMMSRFTVESSGGARVPGDWMEEGPQERFNRESLEERGVFGLRIADSGFRIAEFEKPLPFEHRNGVRFVVRF